MFEDGSRAALGLSPRALAFAIALTLAASGTHSDRELPEVDPATPLERAADFDLADLHGVRTRLSQTEAPVILLHFWTRYRDCKYDLEILQRLHAKYKGRDVKIIGLVYNSGTRDELTAFVADLGIGFPTLMCSSEVRNAYDVTTFPTTFLLNPSKDIRYWKYGHLVESHWDHLITELLEEQTKN
jgi:peroxiredoxin